MTESYDKEFIRLMIVSTAAQQAALGAHYINGADGGITGMNTPGEAGGGLDSSRKIVEIEDHSWNNLAVHAAMYGQSVCKGRYAAVGGYVFMDDTKPVSTKIKKLSPPGAFAKLKDEYVEELKTIPVGLGKDFDHTGLYPRRGRSMTGDSIYLGEDCRGKRHFDCIFFVNWVLTTVLQRVFWFNISQYQNGVAGGAKKKPTETPIRNADIVTKLTDDHKHIGFLTAWGSVIHARMPELGVQVSPFNPKDWTGLCRLSDKTLTVGS